MPYTKDQARAEIANLVANFRANEPSLAAVPEAQIEDTYIRRLFQFLNWNVANTGLSVAQWEFVLQRTDEKGKRPDYILQLDGQQLLVMDAKKVKYDMHDPRWMRQVYAYAYSTQNQSTPRKIDFAILTDFQEFILLDCTLYAADGRVRLTARLKRQILLNNIYGVDIDPQAVEVTRFSLSLKALEDTRRDELREEVNLFQQTILPDLSSNIKCGNSLIGPDYFAGQIFTDKEELLRVRPFDWAREFPQMFNDRPLGSWETLRVSPASGFDAVIGNPPWGADLTSTERQYLVSKYPVVPTKTKDSYLYFLFHALATLRDSGVFGFIIPNTWLLINNAKDCRRELLSFQIEEIIDHGV